MKLLIAGSRNFDPADDWPWETVRFAAAMHNAVLTDTVIVGGAKGIDTIGAEWAKSYGLEVQEHLPDWAGLGKRAGYVRNARMVADATHAIIVWDGKSRGTAHTLDLVQKKGIPYVLVVRPH